MLYKCFWLHCHWILIRGRESDCKFKQDYVREGEAAGAGAPKAGKLPACLLEHRLMKAREEKGKLAAKVAELEAKLKDTESAAQPALSPKVMSTICFSKFNDNFNLQKFVTLSLTDTKIGWSQFGNFADYVNHSCCRARAGDAKALVLF